VREDRGKRKGRVRERQREDKGKRKSERRKMKGIAISAFFLLSLPSFFPFSSLFFSNYKLKL
jgi:hypothetical protein